MNTATAERWFAGRPPNPQARFRLFCFPYAGLGCSAFRGWAGGLGPTVDICPVQLPGRETRHADPPFTRIEPLVDAVADALRPYLDLPFALFGHSMGAVVSYELARRLDVEPHRLFVSARRAPHLPERMPAIAHLPGPEFVAAVQHRYAGIPQAVLESPDLLELLLFRLRADFEVLERYEYRRGAPLACAISVFGGLQDTTVSEADLAGWNEHSRSQVRTRMLSGPHLFLHEQRQAILAAIADDLGSHVPAHVRAAV